MDKPIAIVTLYAGQSWHFRVRRSSRIVVCHGRVVLRCPPQWLGEQWLQTSILLDEGSAHLVADGGWIDIVAEGGAQVAVEQPQPWWQVLAVDWRALKAPFLRPG